ncbi:hypothetical protein ACFVZM_14160 [Streptomyces sioyaensis]|uniref:hypothetical protein n=1 Tax=Streptomyces sioyaensis TaxID=67364 RepID=UPI0036C2325B
MVTARPIFSVLRSRSHRAGPLRLLWLAALLLALVYTHGVSTEGAAGHTSPVLVTSAAAQAVSDGDERGHSAHAEHPTEAVALDEHDDGHDAAHPATACVSSQPEHGADLPAPCEAPLGSVPLLSHAATQAAGPPHAVSESPPLTGSSTVLRI